MFEAVTHLVVIALVATALSVLACRPMEWLCRRLGMVDRPGRDGRRVHHRAVPSGGGVAPMVVVGLALAVVPSAGWMGEWPILLGLGTLVGVGFLDDRFEIGPWPKLLAQAVAVGLLLWGGDVLKDEIVVPLVDVPVRSLWLLGLFQLVLGIGMINALNLIDGLDGLASGVGLVLCLGLAVLAHLAGNGPVLNGAALTGAALLGFLAWNQHPARLFLGDAGSLGLGYLITALAFGLAHPPEGTSERVYGIGVPLLLLVLPWADCAWVMTRRLLHGRHPFRADRSHIHHHALRLGLAHGDATLLLISVAAVVAIIAVLLHGHGRDVHFLTIIILVQAVVGGLRVFDRTSCYRILRLRARRRRAAGDRSPPSGMRTLAAAPGQLGLALLALGPLAAVVVVGLVGMRGMGAPAWWALAASPAPWLLAWFSTGERAHPFRWVAVFLAASLLAAGTVRSMDAWGGLTGTAGAALLLWTAALLVLVAVRRRGLLALVVPKAAECVLAWAALGIALLGVAGMLPAVLASVGLFALGTHLLVRGSWAALGRGRW